MEMVYPKDLLRYLELTGFREETVLEKDRFGVEVLRNSLTASSVVSV